MNKIKKFFIEKPKGNIWKRATIYLILLKYVGPMAVLFSLYFMVGLATPNVDVTESVDVVSQAIASAFKSGMTVLFEAGQSIAVNNPILSKVIFFLLGNVIYVFYAGFFYMIIDIIRHITSWVYNRKRSELTKELIKND